MTRFFLLNFHHSSILALMPIHLREKHFQAAEKLSAAFRPTAKAELRGFKETLAILGFLGGREFFRLPEAFGRGEELHPGKRTYQPHDLNAIQETLGFLPWAAKLLDLEGPELTEDAVEEIEDWLNSTRPRFEFLHRDWKDEAAAILDSCSIPHRERPYLFLLAGLLSSEAEKGTLPFSIALKVISYAFFCGSFP